MSENNWRNLDIDKLVGYMENLKGKVVLGIDGFIDEVWQVLETRISKSEYKLIDKMQIFGQLIVDVGEGGMANELIEKRRISGGFTGNTGRALSNLGLPVVMLGMYGKDGIDPAFDEFKGKSELVSVGSPTICTILEFTDGKIMLPHLKGCLILVGMNW